MSLLVSKVPRTLETKARLFGFELGDLLLVFLYLALSNLFFGHTWLKAPLVWGGTMALAMTLHFAKRGKPDGHLQDYAEYLRGTGLYSAAQPDTQYRPFCQIQKTKGTR